MEEIRRRSRQNEQERFEREVEDEFQAVLEEMEAISLEIVPSDVEIISTDRKLFEHDVFNDSQIDLVIRVRATTPSDFAMERSIFVLPAGRTITIRIIRHASPIRSYRLKLDATKYQPFFNPSDLHDYFVGPYYWKTFLVRYHGAPRYWEDAIKINDWVEPNDLSYKVDAEMRAILANEKENDSEKEQFVNDDEIVLNEAKMNLTNIILMATNISFGDELETDAPEKEDEDYEEQSDEKKLLMNSS